MEFISLVIIIIFLLFIINEKQKKEYIESEYYAVTKNPYARVRFDKGKFGEYLIYKHLKTLKIQDAKFLFNVYVPKENGTTSEIDVLMICSKGIFVFESKNYSGWIFGDENQKNWYQTLRNGNGKSHKESFYNPVLQNRTHIKHLSAYLDRVIDFYSVIVFSERCTLKRINIKSENVKVTKRNNLNVVVKDILYKQYKRELSLFEIEEIYHILYPLSQVSEEIKYNHIQTIEGNRNSKDFSFTKKQIRSGRQHFLGQTEEKKDNYANENLFIGTQERKE